jgi:hypothetical protein
MSATRVSAGLTIDTELFAYGGTKKEIKAQYAWLENDLATVNRTQTPWVIGYGRQNVKRDCQTAASLYLTRQLDTCKCKRYLV